MSQFCIDCIHSAVPENVRPVAIGPTGAWHASIYVCRVHYRVDAVTGEHHLEPCTNVRERYNRGIYQQEVSPTLVERLPEDCPLYEARPKEGVSQ